MEVDSETVTKVGQISVKNSCGLYGQKKSPLIHVNLQGKRTLVYKSVQTESYIFGFVDILDTDNKLKSFTGIDHELLRNLEIESFSNNILKCDTVEGGI